MEFDSPQKEAEHLDTRTPGQLTAAYLATRRQFRDSIKRAIRVSRGSAGIMVNEKRLDYASILFTRITVIARTIEKNLPDCRPREHWDFSSVASLSRNLAEAYLWYFWLCEDEVDVDVREGRFILTFLHDHGSRVRWLPEVHAPEVADRLAKDLQDRFENNPYLATFAPGAKRDALKGHKTPFVQDDVLERMGAQKDVFRSYYRFFSQHTHTGPMSFMRVREHDRGAGVETEHEKRMMIIAVDWANAILTDAIEGHLVLFPDAETRKPHLTDAQVTRNVEVAQGRWQAPDGR